MPGGHCRARDRAHGGAAVTSALHQTFTRNKVSSYIAYRETGGKDKTAMPADAAALVRQLPNATIELHKTCAHAFMIVSVSWYCYCHSGGKDKMAMPEDVAALVRELPDATVVLHHHEPEYEHLDYTWGLDAHKKIYPAVVRLLRDAAAGRLADGRLTGVGGATADGSAGGRPVAAA